MSALLNIGWIIWLVISIFAIYQLIGFVGLTNMFPEGRRSWHLPAQWLSLANFAACVLLNPWG